MVINGLAGAGKTATAFELNRRLPGSWQDIPAWRHSVLELLRRAAR